MVFQFSHHRNCYQLFHVFLDTNPLKTKWKSSKVQWNSLIVLKRFIKGIIGHNDLAKASKDKYVLFIWKYHNIVVKLCCSSVYLLTLYDIGASEWFNTKSQHGLNIIGWHGSYYKFDQIKITTGANPLWCVHFVSLRSNMLIYTVFFVYIPTWTFWLVYIMVKWQRSFSYRHHGVMIRKSCGRIYSPHVWCVYTTFTESLEIWCNISQ